MKRMILKNMDETPSAEADQKAEESLAIKKAYCEGRNRMQRFQAGANRVYQPPRSYDGRPATQENAARGSVWDNLRDWCHSLGLPAVDYVRFQLLRLPEDGIIPEPLQLKAAWRVEHFRKEFDPDAFTAGVETAMNAQSTVLYQAVLVRHRADGLSSVDAHLAALTDGSLEVSPLVRYCTAVSMVDRDDRFHRVAALFKADALAQLRQNVTAYRASSLAKWIPDKLWRLA